MEFYQQFVKEAYDADGVLTEFSIQCPAHFNFGYDVVDALAAKDPNKVCMVWCDQEDRERTFTFGEMSKLSKPGGQCPQGPRHRQGRPRDADAQAQL